MEEDFTTGFITDNQLKKKCMYIGTYVFCSIGNLRRLQNLCIITRNMIGSQILTHAMSHCEKLYFQHLHPGNFKKESLIIEVIKKDQLMDNNKATILQTQAQNASQIKLAQNSLTKFALQY